MRTNPLPKIHLWTILKCAIVVSCIVAFGSNSKSNFEQFLLRKTTLLAEVQSNEAILFPALTFCSKEGFKDVNKMGNNTSLNSYLANTFSLEELFDTKGIPWKPINFSSFVTAHSIFKGRCYTYVHPDKVQTIETLPLIPRENMSLLMYVHEPGEEMWFNYFWFPEMLTVATVDVEDYLLDIALKKEIYADEDECDWTLSDYARCIAADFPTFYQEQLAKGEFPNCTTPWTLRMLGKLDYDDSNSCSLKQAKIEQLAYEPYISQAARFNHTCRAPCERPSYKLTEERYSRKTMGPLVTLNGGRAEKVISIYYMDVNVAKYTNSLVVTFNTFVSNVGGSLGLFLGFSCISVIFLAINKLMVICAATKTKGFVL